MQGNFSDDDNIGYFNEEEDTNKKQKIVCPLLTCQKIYSRMLDLRKHFAKHHPGLDYHEE